jgi:hypothetical protein
VYKLSPAWYYYGVKGEYHGRHKGLDKGIRAGRRFAALSHSRRVIMPKKKMDLAEFREYIEWRAPKLITFRSGDQMLNQLENQLERGEDSLDDLLESMSDQYILDQWVWRLCEFRLEFTSIMVFFNTIILSNGVNELSLDEVEYVEVDTDGTTFPGGQAYNVVCTDWATERKKILSLFAIYGG